MSIPAAATLAVEGTIETLAAPCASASPFSCIACSARARSSPTSSTAPRSPSVITASSIAASFARSLRYQVFRTGAVRVSAIRASMQAFGYRDASIRSTHRGAWKGSSGELLCRGFLGVRLTDQERYAVGVMRSDRAGATLPALHAGVRYPPSLRPTNEEGHGRMKMGKLSVLLAVAAMLMTMLALSGTALALPSEKPDNTPEVDGRVRTIEQVGTNVWVGGNFSKVRQPKGPEVAVSNVAVFNSVTNRYVPIAPKLGDKSSTVWDMAPYGETGNVLIAGKFPGPSSKEGNLLLVDGKSGKVLRWYEEPPELRSVLAAAGRGMGYGGGRSLSGFEFATGKKLWTRAETSVNKNIPRVHKLHPRYHDLELDGKTIWAACACDAV